jgi:DNA polymerase-1
MDTTKLDTAHLQSLLQKLEFRSLLNSLPAHMRAEVPTTETLGGVKLKVSKNTIIDSDRALGNIDLGKADKLFIHSRAAGRHGTDPQVLIIGSDKLVYTLDLAKLDPKKVKAAVGQRLTTSGLVGYDVKSDLKLLMNLGIVADYVEHDVLVAAYLINPLLRAQSLTDLAITMLRYEGAAFEDLPTEDFMARAPEFVSVIMELYHGQQKALEQAPRVEKLAKEVEWPLTAVLADMEARGIKLDTNYLERFSKKLEDSISDLEQTIYGHADHEFNISSPTQLADVLFVKLNLPHDGIKRGKTGYSTAASELEKLRGLHPIVELVGQYREVVKLKNTYVDTLPAQVDENSRLHTTFNLTIAPTGRLSSADPNLQNIPVRTELGRNIRTAFVAEKGNALVSADYSQFEIRLAAALSGDEGMIESFNSDRDIHVETAAAVYSIKPEQVTKDQRYSAKAVNFGIMYGLGPHALSVSSGLSFAEARDFINKYFEIRPKLKKLIEHTRKLALEQGYVETLLGRRRPTPDVKSSNFQVREAAYRAAVNHPLQGTAADLMKLAMVEVAKKLDNQCYMLLQIHDSILIECPAGKAAASGKIAKEVMETIYPKLPVKLKVDISTGNNWGEL